MSGLRVAAVATGGLMMGVVVLGGAAGAGVISLLTGGDVAPSPSASAAIPAGMLSLYEQAASSCPGLPWTVLAAIGTVESSNGTSDLPGVHSGANYAGAEGPMQFESATFAQYDLPVPSGGANPPSPYDPTDAVYAAARDLCANGGDGGGDLGRAVFAFNHDAGYVSEVLDLARSFGQGPAATVAAGTAGVVAADWALAQVGTPYVWGGETPGVGFDCSGLVQAAYQAAGVALPRTAQEQRDATTLVGSGQPLEPGDLVFFGTGPSSVSHVGIYVGASGGMSFMVDAPHTGALVRVEAFPTTVDADWGGDHVLGFTQPGA